jgi:DNA invertase Pin-like site-specific DNA recombinase
VARIIVYSLDRIGRSTLDTLQIIEDIKNKGIKLILIKDNLTIDPYNSNPYNEMMLTMLSAFAQLERSFISERTKAGLAARKAQGIKLGRKKGQQVKSIYDEHREKIEELFTLGLSLKKIVQYINVGSASL